ncbi:SCO family protein [soil metagenome]
MAQSGGAGGRGEAARGAGGNAAALFAVFLCAAVTIGIALMLTLGSGGGGERFRMVDQDGRAVDQRILKGKVSAIFFGYVSCPDVCPATLQALAATQARLTPAEQAKFQVVFVSVDPERDTPPVLKSYLSQEGYPAHAVALTGTRAQVDAITQAYRAYYAYTPRSPAQGGGYDVSHSSAIYLAGPNGKADGLLFEAMGPEAMAAQVKKAMAKS